MNEAKDANLQVPQNGPYSDDLIALLLAISIPANSNLKLKITQDTDQDEVIRAIDAATSNGINLAVILKNQDWYGSLFINTTNNTAFYNATNGDDLSGRLKKKIEDDGFALTSPKQPLMLKNNNLYSVIALHTLLNFLNGTDIRKQVAYRELKDKDRQRLRRFDNGNRNQIDVINDILTIPSTAGAKKANVQQNKKAPQKPKKKAPVKGKDPNLPRDGNYSDDLITLLLSHTGDFKLKIIRISDLVTTNEESETTRAIQDTINKNENLAVIFKHKNAYGSLYIDILRRTVYYNATNGSAMPTWLNTVLSNEGLHVRATQVQLTDKKTFFPLYAMHTIIDFVHVGRLEKVVNRTDRALKKYDRDVLKALSQTKKAPTKKQSARPSAPSGGATSSAPTGGPTPNTPQGGPLSSDPSGRLPPRTPRKQKQTRFIQGTKRHRRVLRDNIEKITWPAIRRLARRGGVKRLQELMKNETRGILKVFLEQTLRDAFTYVEHARRKTLTAQDVVYALKRRGTLLYGFGY